MDQSLAVMLWLLCYGKISFIDWSQLVVVMDQLEVEVDAEGGAILATIAEEVVHVAADDGRFTAVHLTHDDDLEEAVGQHIDHP